MAKNKNESSFITTGERVRSFLGWAFVLALFVHFLVIPFIPKSVEHNTTTQVEKVSVTKKITVKPPTPPPPTPTPPPPPKTTPPPQKHVQRPQPKLKLNVPKTTSKGAGPSVPKYVAPKHGSVNGIPAGQGTASPAPAATVGPPASTPTPPQCQTPYQDAAVNQGVDPSYPDTAREMGMGTATVAVEVTIGPQGQVLKASIAQSSNNMAMDNAAKQAAEQSTYTPKIVNCQPTTGTYLFKVTFDPNS